VATVLYLGEPVHLRLHQSLLFIFIVGFAIIAFRVGEYVTIVVGARAGIGEENSLVPSIADRCGFRVDGFAELGNR
jgi:hypothetical protein